MKQPQNFDALQVPLQGSNLIEASAGTGKTYSVALLALRLILSRTKVSEILLVTFTKAAVGELEQRVRQFVHLAHFYAQGNQTKEGKPIDPAIQTIVEASFQTNGKEATLDMLQQATLMLDETAILTIHSFGQLVLKEYAFETLQLFNMELVADLNEVQLDFLHEYWRKSVTTLPLDLLKEFKTHDYKLNNELMLEISKASLDGKTFLHKEEMIHQSPLDWLKELQSIRELISLAEKNLKDHFQFNASHYQKALKDAHDQNKRERTLLNLSKKDPAEWATSYLNVKSVDDPIALVFADCAGFKEAYLDAKNNEHNYIVAVLGAIIAKGLIAISKQLGEFKYKANVMTFNDIITNLHKAVMGSRKALLQKALSVKFRAVFIDEFQDTDKLQFEIFHTLFHERATLFYIGDPKQSIYGFRNADIDTYQRCAELVHHNYTMNTNYRSSPGYIAALNHFFKPTPDFNTFHSGNIAYHNVEASNGNAVMAFIEKATPSIKNAPALSIFTVEEEDHIATLLVQQVQTLLANAQFAFSDKPQIVPSDIGILVRNKFQAKALKFQLNKVGIKAVTVDDSKLLDSPEAKSILYLLEALLDTKRNNINRALLTNLTGYRLEDILERNEERFVEEFKRYQHILLKEGVFAALNAFAADFQVRHVLLQQTEKGGERALSNFNQLTELLHTVQVNKNLTPMELGHWLKQGISKNDQSGEEYEQRIESDEAAVNILTIHKSKGLQYPIVFVPYMDGKSALTTTINGKTTTKGRKVIFKDDDGYKIVLTQSIAPDQITLFENQQAQENARLIYVALTRGMYKGYVYTVEPTEEERISNDLSAMYYHVDALKKEDALPPEIEMLKLQYEADTLKRVDLPFMGNKTGSKLKFKPLTAKYFNANLQQTQWRKMSYTFLAGSHGHGPVLKAVEEPEGVSIQEAYLGTSMPTPTLTPTLTPVLTPALTTSTSTIPYDNFIFKTLNKGARVGNFLHAIFEYLDFSQPATWERTIASRFRSFYPNKKEAWAEGILTMVEHVIHAEMPIPLAEIDPQKAITELEFDYLTRKFQLSELQKLSSPWHPFDVIHGGAMEGLMNGKIDLFFQHPMDGKYYIVDWKSNYLGDTTAHYGPEALAQAMKDNNYHLQYLLYSLAVKKYLSSKTKLSATPFDYDTQFGGVIYLFLRGCRSGETTGVYFTRPSLEIVQSIENLLNG